MQMFGAAFSITLLVKTGVTALALIAVSQMAEGFLRHLAGDRFDALSAGTQPRGLSADAVKVMAEDGIDISGQRSKNVSEFIGQRFPYVITVCDNAKESCPIFPGAFHTLHWSVPDPAAAEGSYEERMQVFRQVRDEIQQRVQEFLAQPN